MRATCSDCHGDGSIVLRHEDPDGSGRLSRPIEYGCVACAGCGFVDLDPLEDIDDVAPLVEPDAVPLSAIEQWAMLTAKLGGGEQAAIDAARVLRASEAA